MRPVRTRTTLFGGARPPARRRLLQVVGRDRVAVVQAVDAVQPGDVEQDAAGDDRRVLVEAALVPDPAAEVLVGRPAVPELPVEAEVVERVDVRAAVRVHVDRVAAVRVPLVHLVPTPERLSLIDPCGVCVIQIPYGGSPAATQDGMPMKYSTLRSNTWLPSRCSRIARFVSGVIQFRRPISSSGPHGLFETFRPSCSRTAS